jgi:hypothetical protein
MTSLNGAKLLLNKGPPRKITIEDMSDALAGPAIITPHALPMFRDIDLGRGSKRKREKERMDPRKSRRPELPVTGPGKGGRVGASATQHVVQNLVRDTTREEDVREICLRVTRSQLTLLHTACSRLVDPSLSYFSPFFLGFVFVFSLEKHCSSTLSMQVRTRYGPQVRYF